MKTILQLKILVGAFLMLITTDLYAMSKKAPMPPTQPSPSVPIQKPKNGSTTPLWEAKVKGSSEWTRHLLDSALEELGQDLLDVIPSDTNLFCPNYKNLSYTNRKAYWAFMISAMTRYESNFKTDSFYEEGFNDSSGRPVVSRGLLQISIESSKGYSCGMQKESDLHDPLKNLSCGVRILNRWVGRDGRIAGKSGSKWQGGARYWAVLRAGDKESYKTILKMSQQLEICN